MRGYFKQVYKQNRKGKVLSVSDVYISTKTIWHLKKNEASLKWSPDLMQYIYNKADDFY